jgi:serine/threonine protein kinase
MQVIKQVLKGVNYIHSRNVLHRDLKPENMRFTKRTKEWVQDPSMLYIKIIDFGLSCMLTQKEESGWLGTPGETSCCCTCGHSCGCAESLV